MTARKRKRAWHTELASFPDEKPVGGGKRNVIASASVSSAWLHCGDGFQTASSQETKRFSKKTSRAEKCLTPLLNSVEGISKSSNEFTDIVWSSSGSDISDDENKTFTSKFPCLKGEKCGKFDLISRDRYDEDEPQLIDWENESDYADDANPYSGTKPDDISLDILDADSSTSSNCESDEKAEDEFSKMISVEISEYSSDSEKLDEYRVASEATNLNCRRNVPFRSGTGIEMDMGKSARDWLKAAQTLLQTPKKKADKSLRTPEDSAKKRKLLRGGLAERLNRLQNRERAAISFWRHQCVSGDQTPSGGKSGVLTVKIVEMHEECTVCIAICCQLGQICADNTFSMEENADFQPRLKVLFAKETAAHLKAVPQDVIRIYPPWQKLDLLNENIPVIMNTYFSQKVVLKEPTEMDRPHFQETLLIRRNISLAWIFTLFDVKDCFPQPSALNQVSDPDMKTSKTISSSELKPSPFAVICLSDSLLDVVEKEGVAGEKGIRVRVVVQRVYYLAAKEGLKCHLQGNNPSPNILLLNSDLANVRLCLLVQDTYGIFSEIQFQVLFSSSEPIQKYSTKWEGKYCCLSRVKILQRVTRGRVLGLFSLIDSLWPPQQPLTVPGRSQDNEMVTANLLPPSFCYILAVDSDQRDIDTDEGEHISDLYFPPAVHSLKEIVQMAALHHRFSFWAHVVYQRLLITGSTPSSQKQLWLFVTDFSLQSEVEVNTHKILPILVVSSCVVSMEVLEALKSTSPCVIFFKDALCGNGRIICIERTVLSLQKPPLCRAAGSDITELTDPVKLDELDSATQVNSICTVRGVIAGVNERTAFSWPTCNRCGSGKVEQHPQGRGLLYCIQCCEAIISPVVKKHLEVFVHCPSRPLSTVKIKLLQKTISSLLEPSPNEDGCYELKSVLGKEVGFLNCYVQSATNHPSSCVGLEEIILPDVGGS
nr:DNA repair-scaffolding protein [Pogona vitticeps]